MVYRVRVSKYVVVLPFEPLRVGDGFAVNEWPLHVTVLPNFRTQAATRDVARVLRSVFRTLGPVSATVGAEELFGPSGDLLVNVLTDYLPVQWLHEALLEALAREVKFILEVPEYARAGYRPHVTLTPSARATTGNRMIFRQLALVDMVPRGESKRPEVVWTSDLALDSSIRTAR